MSEKSLNELLAEDAFFASEITRLTEERNNLPRNDKQGAHLMMTEINNLVREKRKLKPQIARIREVEGRREQHYLWVSCIRELYGEEDLQLCFEWMRQEKQKRQEEAELNAERIQW
jgi:hypothetical protein